VLEHLMQESVSGRSFKDASLDGMKGALTLKLILLLACCLLVTACPPTGGDLVPLAQGEGAELFTTKFRNDTLRVTRGQVSIKARGLWSIADSNTSVILEISNASAEAMTVDFNRCELVNSDSREKLSLLSVSDETNGNGPAFLSDKIVMISGGQERRFALEFKIDSADASSSVPRNVLGQTVMLRVPVLMKGETPVEVDFVFTFKYAEGQ
jgi:hypothetical protein